MDTVKGPVKRGVLFHQQWGVFIGAFTGALIWAVAGNSIKKNAKDHGLPPFATTWDDMAQVNKFFSTMEITLPATAHLVDVMCIDPDMASMAECHKAELPMWNCFCEGSC